ncbi:chromosome segregation protein SMC [Inhella gelatinilytica]|uniref:Chromosome partition protein Smc n=1 Tax=Inhella gelatinilytica TaxID=2795030 RepID=A0A931IYJ3_9BURK|nr:chromosome segregation protein SMC [Inhella gelatinilytica]MBH9552958.1 chromosome segregation protein SMC [Inhella gelatinilytica]
MRLNSIKLSGFKSFADSTVFQLPGQRVGVVGPNGCGKSNIMDAVRWVLGESKASELRGESMQDVIFNGSNTRKPASRASVELVFDNSLARAGGAWNQFSEIAVKRVLTRDGTSSYFINNQVVRRKDVQDVFLGTGLGPRAYAIIGQGTISRIIESKPEELRLFLEEAAGVSKYKERRRETENRLKDTRENLTRVEDILRELDSNLDRLERQAEVATKYRELQGLGERRLHQLWFLKSRDAAREFERVQAAGREAVNALEARIAELRAIEARLEEVRQAHFAAGDALHAEQGRFAEAQLAVSRLEERIRYVVESRNKAGSRRDEIRGQQALWNERAAQAMAELEQLAEQMAAGDEEKELAAARAEELAAQLPDLEDALRAAQSRANEKRQVAVQVQQQIQVLAAESRALDEQARALRQRRERLDAQTATLNLPDAGAVEQLKERSAEADAQWEEAQARVEDLSEREPELDAARRAAQTETHTQTAQLAQTTARLEALRALQEKVQSQGKLGPWLEKQGLDNLTALWKRLHIAPGWETALEASMRERMAAIEVSRLDLVRAFEQDAPPTRMAFYTLTEASPPATHHALPELTSLLRVEQPGLKALLADWLDGVYTAPDLATALTQRDQLGHGELIVTKAGHAVSRQAVAFYAPDSEQSGLLARAQEIELLEAQRREQEAQVDEARVAQGRADQAHAAVAAQLAEARRAAEALRAQAHALQVDALRLSQAFEAAHAQASRLKEERAELDAGEEGVLERRAEGEARFEELDIQLAEAQQRHADLEEDTIQAERRLNDAREALRQAERRAQEAQFGARALLARQAELQRTQATAQQEAQGGDEQLARLNVELAELDDSAAQAGLQDALDAKLTAEGVLAQARSAYDDLTAQLRKADEERQVTERALEPLRARITELQLEEQAAQLGGAQFREQLEAAGVDPEALAQGIEAEGVRLTGLQGEIDRIQREIAALGAVNLAALEELGSARERKTFLDAQMADLLAAIKTLEDAIRRIDLETQDLLSNTFERVNAEFGRMFPQLFGGGQARLVMTGDSILEAGVQVMAQPPGKKNSTIHLLSGGEKALTAIALVFAIFQLNPAPFCLLDEVDAPLDDANTERYARLVTEMSRGTQFLFISHNKIAMEMAEQLVGVTMQEQGVSRVVAVDMEAALGLAEI